MIRVALLGLALAATASADALADLKGALARLNGQEAVKASVERQIWERSGDAKKPVVVQGKVSAWVEDGAQGLRVHWSREALRQAAQEAKAQAADPEKTTPTRTAMEGLRALELAEYLSASEELLQNLQDAQLQEERAEAWEGRPARCLVLKVTPRLSARDRKYVKEMEATAKVWVGPDGLPLAAERSAKMKGRALLVVSFQSEQHEFLRFARAGNRLVVLHHSRETSGSGGGESNQRKTVTTLTLGS